MANKQKVILVNPLSVESDHIQPPLGLGYLATSLRKNGFEVEILDAQKEKITTDKLPEIIKKSKPDFVGFQVYTFNLNYVKEGLKKIRSVNKKIITLVGGPHISALPNDVFKTFDGLVDFAFRGEAEIGLPILLKKIIDNDKSGFDKIPGLIYKKNNKIFLNQPLFYKDIDIFDMPAWDLIKPQNYPEAQHGAFFENFPIAPIITTRGCPFNCSFCSGRLNTGMIVRKRKVSSVIEEIKTLYNVYHIREILIIDDNFTFDKIFAKNVLKEIIKLKLDASFAVPNGVRLDTLDLELLKLMKMAGFYLISVGIESGSNRVLKLMQKSLSKEKIREQINLIIKSGLDCAGFFILGYPGETEEEAKETIEFSLNLGLLRAFFFTFIPLPGTPITEELQKKGIIDQSCFTNYSFSKPVFTKEISEEKLKKLRTEAFLRFYLFRPKILFQNFSRFKRPVQFYFLFKRIFRWMV